MAVAPTSNDAKHREVIRVEHLWAAYDHEAVLEDVNLTVYERDFIGLIGPNGGGKTTLLRVLLGLLSPLRGTVRIMGKPAEEGRGAIGWVPQQAEFDRDFPIRVRDVVRMGRLGHRRLFQRYRPEDDRRVDSALEAVGLEKMAERALAELSGGQRQRVYVARALASDPAILLLDEPTAHLDVSASSSFYELLHELNQRITILMVSHDLTAISSYVKTVGCLSRRLYYQHGKTITPEMLDASYQCPVDLLAHGVPHRVLPEHTEVSHDA
ncbi:MAG: metal ABC transporter ATP-binding protein [Anaerolineae bacterium]